MLTTNNMVSCSHQQGLASVAIPGGVINLIVRSSRLAVARTPVGLPMMVSQWFPTAAGIR